MGDGKQEGNGKLGICLSLSLVVLLLLYLLGSPPPLLVSSVVDCADPMDVICSGCNVGWSAAGVALVAMMIEGIATQTSPNWVFKNVCPRA